MFLPIFKIRVRRFNIKCFNIKLYLITYYLKKSTYLKVNDASKMFPRHPWLKWQPLKVHQWFNFEMAAISDRVDIHTIVFLLPSPFKQGAPQNGLMIKYYMYKLPQKWVLKFVILYSFWVVQYHFINGKVKENSCSTNRRIRQPLSKWQPVKNDNLST